MLAQAPRNRAHTRKKRRLPTGGSSYPHGCSLYLHVVCSFTPLDFGPPLTNSLGMQDGAPASRCGRTSRRKLGRSKHPPARPIRITWPSFAKTPAGLLHIKYEVGSIGNG